MILQLHMGKIMGKFFLIKKKLNPIGFKFTNVG